jgi:hypothetical protein
VIMDPSPKPPLPCLCIFRTQCALWTTFLREPGAPSVPSACRTVTGQGLGFHSQQPAALGCPPPLPCRALLKNGYAVVLLHRDTSKRPFRRLTAEAAATLDTLVDLGTQPPCEHAHTP